MTVGHTNNLILEEFKKAARTPSSMRAGLDITILKNILGWDEFVISETIKRLKHEGKIVDSLFGWWKLAPEQTEMFPTGDKATSPGGEHYRKHGPVEPIDLIESYNLGYHEANIVKYVCRWKDKHGIEDLQKAQWYLTRLIARVSPPSS